MTTFSTFGCWYGLQTAIDEKVSLYYHAPLDTAPRPIFVTKRFRNGKIRVTSGEVTFTADPSHFDRFRWIERSDKTETFRNRDNVNTFGTTEDES